MYHSEIVIKNKDVNRFRRLRTSALFEFLQEASIAHTEQLGYPRQKTLDRGLLWVICQQELQIRRMPEYDETIEICSWPGEMNHVFFPRYYRVETKAGEVLAEGSAMWLLMDQVSRKMIFPSQWNILIPGENTGRETPLPKRVLKQDTVKSEEFTVPFSYCDLNGHMNNIHYFDLAEDRLKGVQEGRLYQMIRIEYANEIRYGQTVTLNLYEDENGGYLCGDAEKNCFRLLVEYKER